MRTVFGPCLVLLAIGAGALVSGCDLDQAKQVVETAAKTVSYTRDSSLRPLPPAPPPPAAARGTGTIHIATFNIQVFGQSKLDKPEVVDVLAQVVRQFDVVAVQELRSREQDVIPRFLEHVNADGARYDSVVGERVGRTSSKEQYVYVYDATRIEVDPASVRTTADPSDLLHREPLVARFRVRGPPTESAFTFTLVNIHTDPDEVTAEVNALDDVLRHVRRAGGEDDVILLGDLNADFAHLGELAAVPNIHWVINGEPTNTRRTESYDNILFDHLTTREYTGRFGVLDLQSAHRLSEDQALEISDHMPVWAEFSAIEHRAGRIAEAPGGSRR